MLGFKPGAQGERGDLAPRAAERRAGEPGNGGSEGNSHTTGLGAAKHIPVVDRPLEIFVICAQGVCSFFRTPQRRAERQGEGRNHRAGPTLGFRLGQVHVPAFRTASLGDRFNIFCFFFMTFKLLF